MPKNEIDSLASRLALANAILEAVKESGLLRKARRVVRRKRRAGAKAAAKPKRGTKTNPLSKVPTEPAAA